MEATPPTPVDVRLRLLGHALLACALAMAANKFFIVNLEHELANGFYAKIFALHGEAPDQYRILPLLPLALLCKWLPFNHAVLLYNVVFGFAALELQWRLVPARWQAHRWALAFALAILYIFFQYTGWRPDTMGLYVLSCAAALALRDLRDRSLRWAAYGLAIVAMSLSRADMALIFALFATFHQNRSYAAFIPIPIIAQTALQRWIFPDARYYTKVFMLMDNLGGKYLLNHPGTYLILAALVVFHRPVWDFVRATIRENYYFYLLLAGYLLMVLLIGRLNEYRLYMPFIPLLLLIVHGRRQILQR